MFTYLQAQAPNISHAGVTTSDATNTAISALTPSNLVGAITETYGMVIPITLLR
jgi:hypothetical protein